MRVNEVHAGEASAILPDFPLSRALGDPVPSYKFKVLIHISNNRRTRHQVREPPRRVLSAAHLLRGAHATLAEAKAGKSTKSALVAMSSSERFAQLRPWTCCNGKQPELLACRDLPVCV